MLSQIPSLELSQGQNDLHRENQNCKRSEVNEKRILSDYVM